jgi:hypothetical protein
MPALIGTGMEDIVEDELSSAQSLISPACDHTTAIQLPMWDALGSSRHAPTMT